MFVKESVKVEEGDVMSQFTKNDTQKVKGLAIILMMIHHCFLGPERYKGQIVSFWPFLEANVNHFALAMKICVALFTFLSAYGMYLSYKNKMEAHGGTLRLKDVYTIVSKRLITLMCGYWSVFLSVQAWSLVVARDHRFIRVYGRGIKSALYFIIDLLGLAEFFRTPTFLATFWYMSLALIIIILMPVLTVVYKKCGAIVLLPLSVLFAVLFPVTSKHTMAYLPSYLTCVCLGSVTAEHDWIVKLKKNFTAKKSGCMGRKVVRLVLELSALILLLHWRQLTRYTSLLPIWDAIIPLLIIVWMFEYVNTIPYVGQSLYYLGVHSMNIFLIHNFVRVIWYYKFTYSFKYASLIVIVLLCISLVVSVLLERVKVLCHYGALVDWLQNKVLAKIERSF